MLQPTNRSFLRALRKVTVGMFTVLSLVCIIGLSALMGENVVVETKYHGEGTIDAHSEHSGHTHDSHKHTQHGEGHENESDEHGHHHHHIASSLDFPLIVHPTVEDVLFLQVTLAYSKLSDQKCPLGPCYEIIKPPQVS